jgi:hypothetical protein
LCHFHTDSSALELAALGKSINYSVSEYKEPDTNTEKNVTVKNDEISSIHDDFNSSDNAIPENILDLVENSKISPVTSEDLKQRTESDLLPKEISSDKKEKTNIQGKFTRVHCPSYLVILSFTLILLYTLNGVIHAEESNYLMQVAQNYRKRPTSNTWLVIGKIVYISGFT